VMSSVATVIHPQSPHTSHLQLLEQGTLMPGTAPGAKGMSSDCEDKADWRRRWSDT